MKHLFLVLVLVVGCGKSMPSNMTAQSNIRRYVQGTQLQINMISCNDESPNDSNQVYCDAFVRHAIEGTEYQVRLRCDQTRVE